MINAVKQPMYKTRAQHDGDLVTWPYLYKQQPCVLIIRRTVEKHHPDGDMYNIGADLFYIENRKIGRRVDISRKEMAGIMSLILWHEGKRQVEKAKEENSSPPSPEERWTAVVNNV